MDLRMQAVMVCESQRAGVIPGVRRRDSLLRDHAIDEVSRLPQRCRWDRHPQRWIRNLITGICLLANGLLTCEQTAALQPSILPRRAPMWS